MQPQDIVQDLLRRKWTQDQIAARTGIPQPSISKVARGAVKDVMASRYLKLKALHEEVLAAEAAKPPAGAAANPADAKAA